MWVAIVAAIALLVVIAISETRARRNAVRTRNTEQRPLLTNQSSIGRASHVAAAGSTIARTPSEVVSNKVSQFGAQRREITYALAAKYKISVPADVQEFYEAIESGDWDRIDALYKKIGEKKESGDPGAEDLRRFSAPMLEAYGVAEQAHLWPADRLLDYGHAILDSLKPGMVYIGGTDAGRFIPTLLNDTAVEGERHVVITQNALADNTYLEYFDFLHGENVKAADHGDAEKVFQDFIADAKKRFEHDRDFPDEPRQVRPGESFTMNDGSFNISGANAVMQINEKILQAFMNKNPDLTFAMEESFPFKSLYGSAQPLGPIFEINGAEGKNDFNENTAQAALDYWKNTAQQITSDTSNASSEEALKAYSHMVKAQATLFSDHGFAGDAEQAYQIARQLWPANIEAAAGLSDLYANQGRNDESQRILADFARRFPDQRPQVDRWLLTHSLFQDAPSKNTR